MRKSPPTCALGLGIESLTAWGDGQLSPAEAQRVAAHVPTCAACQNLVQDFALIKQRLHVDNGPDLRPEIWRGVQAGMRRPAARAAHNSGAIWRGGAALGAVIVLVALFAQVLQFGRNGRPSVSVVPTGTATVAPPTLTPTTSTLHLPGWQNAGPAYAGSIAFAPTAPLTGYTCGKVGGGPTAALFSANRPRSSGPGPTPLTKGNIPFGVTHDSGKTWTTLATGVTGTACAVTVNPTNAQDVVIAYDTDCIVDCIYQNVSGLARSTDGGQTWRPLTIPSDPASGGKLTVLSPGWAAGTLIDSAQSQTGAYVSYLLTSVQDGPLTLISPATILRGMPANAVVGNPIGVGAAIYLDGYTYNNGVFSGHTLISRDNGATWRYEQLSYENIPVVITGSSADGTIITGTFFSPDGPQPVGEPEHLPMLESRDGGATWTQLPLPATGEFYMHGIGSGITGIMPNGTIFALCHITSSDSFGIFELEPGASAWKLIAPGLIEMLQAIATDAAGRPIALWGHAGATLDNITNEIYGLQYFPLGGK